MGEERHEWRGQPHERDPSRAALTTLVGRIICGILALGALIGGLASVVFGVQAIASPPGSNWPGGAVELCRSQSAATWARAAHDTIAGCDRLGWWWVASGVAYLALGTLLIAAAMVLAFHLLRHDHRTWTATTTLLIGACLIALMATLVVTPGQDGGNCGSRVPELAVALGTDSPEDGYPRCEKSAKDNTTAAMGLGVLPGVMLIVGGAWGLLRRRSSRRPAQASRLRAKASAMDVGMRPFEETS